jgi:hypothetical protein
MFLEVIGICRQVLILIRNDVHTVFPGACTFNRTPFGVADGAARARRRREEDHCFRQRLSLRVHNFPSDRNRLPQRYLQRSHRLAIHVEALPQYLLVPKPAVRRTHQNDGKRHLCERKKKKVAVRPRSSGLSQR